MNIFYNFLQILSEEIVPVNPIQYYFLSTNWYARAATRTRKPRI